MGQYWNNALLMHVHNASSIHLLPCFMCMVVVRQLCEFTLAAVACSCHCFLQAVVSRRVHAQQGVQGRLWLWQEGCLQTDRAAAGGSAGCAGHLDRLQVCGAGGHRQELQCSCSCGWRLPQGQRVYGM